MNYTLSIVVARHLFGGQAEQRRRFINLFGAQAEELRRSRKDKQIAKKPFFRVVKRQNAELKIESTR